jgi:hypothetical protein
MHIRVIGTPAIFARNVANETNIPLCALNYSRSDVFFDAGAILGRRFQQVNIGFTQLFLFRFRTRRNTISLYQQDAIRDLEVLLIAGRWQIQEAMRV